MFAWTSHALCLETPKSWQNLTQAKTHLSSAYAREFFCLDQIQSKPRRPCARTNLAQKYDLYLVQGSQITTLAIAFILSVRESEYNLTTHEQGIEN